MLSRDKQFYKDFLRLAVTLMLEQAVILSVNLVDNVMLGAYNEASLSGVAAVNQVQFIFQQLVYAVNSAMIILGSQYFGAGNRAAVGRLSSIGVRIELVLALVLFTVVSLFPQGTLRLFTEDAAIISEGVKYLDIMRFSYPFFALTAIMLGTLRIAKSVQIALRVSIVSLVINITLNFVFIFGRFGAPELGVRGAAVGTIAARIVECGIVAAYLFLGEKQLSLKPRSYLVFDRRLFADFLRVGTPVMITMTLWGLSNAIQTMILGHMNDHAIAAQSISSTLYLLLKVACVGASSAASILIGQAIGAGRMDRIREYTRTLQLLFLAIALLMGLMMFLIRIPLLAIYDIAPQTHRLANHYMLIQSVVMVGMGYEMPVGTGIINGGGDTRFMMIVDLISIWGIVIPVSLLAAFVWKLPPEVVIICLNADQIFKCIPTAIRVNSYRWVKKLTRPAA